jgi:hypothetical protein
MSESELMIKNNKLSKSSLPKVAFIFFIFLLSLGQLERIQIGISQAFYAFDVFIAIWVCFQAFIDGEFRKELLLFVTQRTKLEVFFGVWVILGIGAALLRQGFSLSPLLYLARITLYGSFALLQWHLIRKKKFLQYQIMIGYLGAAVLFLYFGLLQYFFLPDTRFLFFLGWDDHYYRLISTIFDPGFAGILLVLGFFFCRAIVEQSDSLTSHLSQFSSLFTKRSRGWKILQALISTAFLIGVLLTYSRASFLALGAGMLISIFFFTFHKLYKKAFFYFLISVGFGVSIFLLPRPGGEGVKLERTSTITARREFASSTLSEMKATDWILGEGIFVPPKESGQIYDQPNHAHIADNWVLFFLSGTGVIGLGIFLLILSRKVVQLFQINQWLGVSFITILVHSLFSASLVYPFVILFFSGMYISLKRVH